MLKPGTRDDSRKKTSKSILNFVPKTTLFFLLVFLLAGLGAKAHAASYYVRPSGDNSCLGTYNNDYAGHESDKQCAWKTIVYAEAHIAASGDSVTVAAGTYAENDGANGSWTSAKSADWIGVGTVIFREGVSGYQAANFDTSATASFTNIIFDGNRTSAKAVTFTANAANKTFNNCSFINSTTTVFRFNNGSSNITINNSTVSNTASITDGIIYGYPKNVIFNGGTWTTPDTYNVKYLYNCFGATGSSLTLKNLNVSIDVAASTQAFAISGINNITLQDNVINFKSSLYTLTYPLNGSSGSFTSSGNSWTYPKTTSFAFIYFMNPVASWNISITEDTFHQTDTADSKTSVIYIRDQISPIVDSNTFTIDMQSISTGFDAIIVTSSGTNCVAPSIKDNTIYSHNLHGHGIMLGGDGSGPWYEKLTGAVISGNKIYGENYFTPGLFAGGTNNGLHGIIVGDNSGVKVFNNYVNGCGYGIVMKGSSQSYAGANGVYNNLLVNNLPFAGIDLKGYSDLPCYNNTVYQSEYFHSSLSASFNAILADVNNSTYHNSNLLIKNNVLYGGKANISQLIDIQSGEETGLVLSNNIFYMHSGGHLAGIAGTNYNTIEALNGAGYGTGNISANPIFVSATTETPPTLPSSYNLTLSSISPAINSGTNAICSAFTNLNDYIGNSICSGGNFSGYGIIDMGAYEYQPAQTAGTDEIDTGSGARVYGGGKFQNIGSASGTTANLSVVPQSSDTTKWVDITKADDESSIIWEENHKKWKESSSTLEDISTLHTVGDLESNTNYSVTIDGALATANISGEECSNGICSSDSEGKIAFYYNGGYSEHTFEITNTPPIINITNPESNDTVTSDDTITFTNSETTDPQCSLDNSHWDDCTSATTSFNDLTNWSSINEKDTFTLYIKDTDVDGNTGTAQVADLTKADQTAPIRSNGSPSSSLSTNTTSAILSLTTSESATCKYSTQSGTSYADMTNSLEATDGTTHTKNISGLTNGEYYYYYIRCEDTSHNYNDTDYLISFSVAASNTDNNTDNDKNLNVHNVKAESTENTITITWKTDHNTKSIIRYGKNKNLEEKRKDNNKEKKHNVTLSDLSPNTKYYFRIKATDSDDNEDSSNIHFILTKPSTIKTASPIPSSTSIQIPTYSGSAAPSICSYTVQSGDTLWTIAKNIYGDATAYSKIIEKNKVNYPEIESKLSIGQELIFCDTDQNKQNNSMPASESGIQINSSQENSASSTFRWWNPFTWF